MCRQSQFQQWTCKLNAHSLPSCFLVEYHISTPSIWKLELSTCTGIRQRYYAIVATLLRISGHLYCLTALLSLSLSLSLFFGILVSLLCLFSKPRSSLWLQGVCVCVCQFWLGLSLAVVVILSGLFQYYQDSKSSKIMKAFENLIPHVSVVLLTSQTSVLSCELLLFTQPCSFRCFSFLFAVFLFMCDSGDVGYRYHYYTNLFYF